MKKVAFITLGCKVNQYETNAMTQQFIEKGYKVVDHTQKADIYIVNTCTVTNMSDRKSRQMLRRVKELNKEAIVVACGCYAQVAKEELEKIEEINLVLGNNEKKEIVEHIEKYITKDRQKYDNTLGALKVLQEKLGLKHLPRRMECYDISNISGTNKVSSMVVFENGEPKKKDYRKFKIKTVQGIDDFASLRETLTRRLTRYKNQDGESFSSKPDLLIIDGGKGQLSSCFEILQKMGLSDQIEMVSLAKRLEEVFLPNNPVPVVLDHSTAALKLLQRIRDEAHRFAITFHRELRGKSMLVSELDEINGIGPKKRRLLTEAFENIEQIKNTTPEELAVVKGIDIKLAHTIYAHFHKDNQKT